MEPKSNVNRIARQLDGEAAPRPAPANATRPLPVHELQSGKKFCEASPDWCRVCEKMSDTPVIRSDELLQGHREVLILHGDEVYRLLCTKNNKLILQK